MRHKLNGPLNRKKVEGKCVICEAEFPPSYTNRLYCSESCKQIAKRARRRAQREAD